jgi:hypothetical protein
VKPSRIGPGRVEQAHGCIGHPRFACGIAHRLRRLGLWERSLSLNLRDIVLIIGRKRGRGI